MIENGDGTMTQPGFHVDVRGPAEGILILDLRGEITALGEEALFAAHHAAGRQTRVLVLNLGDVRSIDSAGAGLLIALQARAQTQKQRLLAYGLSEPCRQAFASTYLDTVVGLYPDEVTALRGL